METAISLEFISCSFSVTMKPESVPWKVYESYLAPLNWTEPNEQKRQNDFNPENRNQTRCTNASNLNAAKQCGDRERVEDRRRRPLTLSIKYNRGSERKEVTRETNTWHILNLIHQGPKRRKEGLKTSVYLIDHVGAVGGGQHGDVSELLDAVHLCQELSEDAVADTAGAWGAGEEDENRR